jgi:hypothetical protein
VEARLLLEADVAKIAWMVLLLWGTILSAQTKPSDMIGAIDFYGYQGLNVASVRAALPVHVGSALNTQTKPAIEASIAKATGKKPTEVAQICCDPKGRLLIYIGLHGETFKPFALNRAPTGTEHLPPEIVELSSHADDALDAAILKGENGEDDSQGFTLAKNPAARALQMQERTWALAHGPELLQVLRNSADADQREIASDLLGYAQQSQGQITALVRASRDPDSDVRNSATRALGVLVESNAKLAAKIEPDTFIAMLASGIWTDRNKAIWLLAPMTAGRNPQLLAKIRAHAFGQLVEMARWTDPGHALGARLVLGRLARIPEDKLEAMLQNGPPDSIIEAAGKR